MTKLSEAQLKALTLASHGLLVCAYGNQFFVAGSDGLVTCERSTLMSLYKLGLVNHSRGITGRGEFTLTAKGRRMLEAIHE